MGYRYDYEDGRNAGATRRVAKIESPTRFWDRFAFFKRSGFCGKMAFWDRQGFWDGTTGFWDRRELFPKARERVRVRAALEAALTLPILSILFIHVNSVLEPPTTPCRRRLYPNARLILTPRL